jgi:hypothetical protein
LDRCIQSHVECRQESVSLPKRVLNITPGSICLFEPEFDLKEPYVALSHCWGGLQPLQTTKSSINERKDGIKWDSLPAVFQDAVTVTRRLRLDYLWIDSLCIVQDDIADWEEESSKMASIYENAYLTIAAASSRNGQASFLEAKHSNEFDPLIVKFRHPNGQRHLLKARRRNTCGHHWEDGLERKDPLDWRAWVLQERDLSTRMVIYTSAEVQWRCKKIKACECQNDWDVTNLSTVHHIQHAPDAYLAWQHLIQEFTKRILTVESDKLPAVAGLATKVHKMTGSPYFAGIWQGNILEDLC